MLRKTIGATVALAVAVLAVSLAAAEAAKPASPLAAVRSWGYQLQNVEPAEIAASPFDLVVVDYSRNGVDAGRFMPDEVKTMQRKPDGSRRIVLAYLSIGEAEDYRFYWQQNWVEPAPLKREQTTAIPAPGAQTSVAPEPVTVRIPRLVAPGWLGRENEVWSGNYLVRYWYDGWQNIIMHHDTSYLARIQAAGFDGVYLDRVDAYYSVEADRQDAARRMIDFVVELASLARARRPGFLIVPQNGEELLADPRYVATIDAVAKEDLFLAAPTEPKAPAAVAGYLEHLGRALAAGKPVLVAEYTESGDIVSALDATARARGTIPYFGTRTLDRLIKQPAPAPR